MIDDKITDVVQIKSNDKFTCRICGFSTAEFDNAINHMIAEHGYNLKFFGTESYTNDVQMPFHYTVAMMAK